MKELFTDWSHDDVIVWLETKLKLDRIDTQKWKDLGINGKMLECFLDDDGHDLLKNELGIPSKIHRNYIINGVKHL